MLNNGAGASPDPSTGLAAAHSCSLHSANPKALLLSNAALICSSRRTAGAAKAKGQGSIDDR